MSEGGGGGGELLNGVRVKAHITKDLTTFDLVSKIHGWGWMLNRDMWIYSIIIENTVNILMILLAFVKMCELLHTICELILMGLGAEQIHVIEQNDEGWSNRD